MVYVLVCCLWFWLFGVFLFCFVVLFFYLSSFFVFFVFYIGEAGGPSSFYFIMDFVSFWHGS